MDEGSLPPVRNCEFLVDALGFWPSFHDAHVLSASRAGDRCEVLIYVFRMTDKVDEQGYFVSADHHRVSFTMTGVSECTLPDNYEPDVLFELLFECSEDAVTATFSSVMDQDWRVRCRAVDLSNVVPCGPRGESAI